MDTIENEVRLAEPVAETTVEEPKFDGLSNREALEKSLQIHREETPAPVQTETPTAKEVSQAVAEEVDPPAEFSARGKEAWRNKDIAAIQREFKRIHDSRTAEVTRAQQAEREARESAKPARELAERVKNYLSVRGEENLPDEVKIAQALQLVEEMRKRDGDSVRAELLKLGIDLDKKAAATSTSEVNTLLEKVNRLEQKDLQQELQRQEQQFQRTVATFDAVFNQLTSEKTRTGDRVFPDLNDTEEGIQLASEIGSLVRSESFQARVIRRFPNADLGVVVREAYKALGGQVAGDPVKVSNAQNQHHIERSRRASAAVPGRTAPRVNEGNLAGKLSKRAALEKALELHRDK